MKEKHIKLKPVKTKIIRYQIDSTLFYFDAEQFLNMTGANQAKAKFHSSVVNELGIQIKNKDTVDVTQHKQPTVISSLANDALEKGFVKIIHAGQLYKGKNITNIEYWDKDVLSSEYKESSLYRPEGDVFTLPDGTIFFYFKSPVTRTEHRFH